MSNSTLFKAGSIHQAHERFSGISRGRQCSFMSFSALLCGQSFPVQQWTSETIDKILIEGDRMYLAALRNRVIPDAETLSLNYLPVVVRWSIETTTNKSPVEANKSPIEANKSPIEANKPNESPIEAQTNNQSSIVVTNTDLPMVVEPIEAQTKAKHNQTWLISYKEFYQGRIHVEEHENEAPYFTLHSALMNTFANDNYAFIILEGYIMALIKVVDAIYVFDSHAHNSVGMPDSNGTAVVMECADISGLHEYISCLSATLNSQCFEIVPVYFNYNQTNTSACSISL